MCKILYNIHITYFIVILSHLSDVSTYNLQIVVKLCKLLVVYGPADLTVHHPPPPLPNCQGSVYFFSVYVSSIPQKLVSKESLNISELFRLKDHKTWVLRIFTQNRI